MGISPWLLTVEDGGAGGGRGSGEADNDGHYPLGSILVIIRIRNLGDDGEARKESSTSRPWDRIQSSGAQLGEDALGLGSLLLLSLRVLVIPRLDSVTLLLVRHCLGVLLGDRAFWLLFVRRHHAGSKASAEMDYAPGEWSLRMESEAGKR